VVIKLSIDCFYFSIMSESDAVDTLLRETESLFSDSLRRTAPTHSAMGDRGGEVGL